jgi:probable rRNA maturation factor
VISTEYAMAEAKARGIAAAEELLRYVAHGILHLAGYDDHAPADRRKMWRRQEMYVEREMGDGFRLSDIRRQMKALRAGAHGAPGSRRKGASEI